MVKDVSPRTLSLREDDMRLKCVVKTFLLVGLVIGICGFSMQANAMSFSYSQSTGFSVVYGTLTSNDIPRAYYNSDENPYNDIKWYNNNALGVTPPTGYYDTIFWGGSNNHGGVRYTDPWENGNYSAMRVLGVAGTVSTGSTAGEWGDWVTITNLYHQNNAISSTYYTLTSALFWSELTIGTALDQHALGITFNETLNSGSCSGPSGMGTCPDEFAFDAAGFSTVSFQYDGKTYEAMFQLGNFLNSQLVCADDGTCTVWTAEGKTSSLSVQMAIREVAPVPEPSTLVLFGLGLLGVGLASRRSKA